MLLGGESNMEKWSPLGSLWFSNQPHVRLMRETIALAGVTGNAGANHVFPGGQATFVPREHVIEVEFASFKGLTAILTGVVVPLKDIVPGKLYFFLRQAIKQQQDDHSWNPDLPGNGVNHLVVFARRGNGKVAPALEVMSGEVILLVRRYHLGVPLVEQSESATSRAYINRLPKAVKH